MRLLVLFIVFIGAITNISAQEDYKYEIEADAEEDKKNSYQAYIFNLHLDKVTGLNNLLLSNNYPQVNPLGFQYGIRFGRGKSNRKLTPLLEATYYSRGASSSTNLSNSANFVGWGAGIGAEYKLIDTKYFFAKPMILINYANYTLNLINNQGADTIDDVINSDFQEYAFRSIQFPLQGGINLGTKVNIGDASIGIILGAGYIYNWQNDDWAIGQGTVVNDNINLASPYASIGLFSSMN